MCKAANKDQIKATKMRNAAKMYNWSNKKAVYHSKEAQFLKGKDNYLIGYTRDRGSAQTTAFSVASQARLGLQSAATQYYINKRVDEGDGSATSSRNELLGLLAKNYKQQAAVDQAWGVGIQTDMLAAGRRHRSKVNKLYEKLQLASPPQPPLLEKVPKEDQASKIMSGVGMALKLAPLIAAPFTGGASLKLMGIGGGGGTMGGLMSMLGGGSKSGGGGGGGNLFSSAFLGNTTNLAGLFSPSSNLSNRFILPRD